MSAEFPFLGTTQAISSVTLPIFKTYAWDFERDCFIRDGNGRLILLEKNDALEVWIYKALKTERFIYKAYSWRYGSSLYEFIGKNMSVGERISEMKRMIIETLMVNPYIKSIDRVEFTKEERGEELLVAIDLTTIYGKMTV